MRDHEAIKLAIQELTTQKQKLHRLQQHKKREAKEFAHGTIPWLKLYYQADALALAAGMLQARVVELEKIVSPFQQWHQP